MQIKLNFVKQISPDAQIEIDSTKVAVSDRGQIAYGPNKVKGASFVVDLNPQRLDFVYDRGRISVKCKSSLCVEDPKTLVEKSQSSNFELSDKIQSKIVQKAKNSFCKNQENIAGNCCIY